MAIVDTKKFLDESGLEYLVGILRSKISAVEDKIPTDFYTKSQVDSAISTAKSEIIGGADEDYMTLKMIEEWVEEHQDLYQALLVGIGTKADKKEVNDSLATKANAADVYKKSEVYTQDEVDNLLKGVDVSEQLKEYYKKSETYSKKEVESKIAEAVEDFITEDALDGYATEEYVDDAIEALSEVYQPKGEYLTEHQSLEEYAKSEDVTAEITDAVKDFITLNDLDGYATEEWVEEQGYLTDHQSLEDYAKSTDVASEIEEAIKTITAISTEEIDAIFEEIF